MRHTLTIAAALVVICLLARSQAQVAIYETSFPSVSMPSQIGQQVFLGSLPITSLSRTARGGIGSFDFQSLGVFHGDWTPVFIDIQWSVDLFLCDKSDCSGPTRSQIAHIILVPFARSACLDGIMTLRGTFVRASGTAYTAVYTGMLDGLWTGKIITQDRCGHEWEDGLIDSDTNLATGPIGAFPWAATDSVDTTRPLFLGLTATIIKNDEDGQGVGQISLMRVVTYP
jgi:hypothetical protein